MKTTTANSKALVDSIVEGIKEKKGKNIVIIDMANVDDSICNYMVIAEGNTPVQVEAIQDSVLDTARIQTGEKPLHTHIGNGEWVAMDYVDVMVHIFVPTLREFYNIEQLWADAKQIRVEND